MVKIKTKEIMPGLLQIEAFIPRRGFDNFLALWLLRDEKRKRIVLIETGPASSSGPLTELLRAIGVCRVDYLFYTHVHLDHSGGAGQFHREFPEAKILAPAKGRRHLVSPQALVEGTITSLGEDVMKSYGLPLALPESALVPEHFEAEGLEILETPGHAAHHNSYIYDLGGRRILFAGEAAGVFKEISDGVIYTRPATPHKFFYDTALKSIEVLTAQKDIDLICYPHYGCSANAYLLLQRAARQMKLWKDIVGSLPRSASIDACVDLVLREDPYISVINMLDSDERSREDFFIRQSVTGYKRYLFG